MLVEVAMVPGPFFYNHKAIDEQQSSMCVFVPATSSAERNNSRKLRRYCLNLKVRNLVLHRLCPLKKVIIGSRPLQVSIQVNCTLRLFCAMDLRGA